MSLYIWMKDSEDEVADQLVGIGEKLTAYKGPLGVRDGEILQWKQGAAMFYYVQHDIVAALRKASKEATDARDLLEVDKTPEPFLVPTVTIPPLPAELVGVTVQTNFFAWCDKLVKRFQSASGYTDQIGTELGLVTTRPQPIKATTPRIKGKEVLPGGVIKLDIFRGGHPLTIIESSVDGGAWEVKGQFAASKVQILAPDGAEHRVAIRTRFAERDGTPVGQYSEVVNVVSLP